MRIYQAYHCAYSYEKKIISWSECLKITLNKYMYLWKSDSKGLIRSNNIKQNGIQIDYEYYEILLKWFEYNKPMILYTWKIHTRCNIDQSMNWIWSFQISHLKEYTPILLFNMRHRNIFNNCWFKFSKTMNSILHYVNIIII